MKYDGYGYKVDAERIHKVMKFLNWKWSPIGRVPTVQEIEDKASSMVQSLKDDPQTIATQTGGFHVRREKDETGTEFFNVSFELDHADYY